MKSDGYGGRGGITLGDEMILNGVLGTDERPAGARMRPCAFHDCGKWFLSRQEGDDYCSERCDIAVNPGYRAPCEQMEI